MSHRARHGSCCYCWNNNCPVLLLLLLLRLPLLYALLLLGLAVMIHSRRLIHLTARKAAAWRLYNTASFPSAHAYARTPELILT